MSNFVLYETLSSVRESVRSESKRVWRDSVQCVQMATFILKSDFGLKFWSSFSLWVFWWQCWSFAGKLILLKWIQVLRLILDWNTFGPLYPPPQYELKLVRRPSRYIVIISWWMKVFFWIEILFCSGYFFWQRKKYQSPNLHLKNSEFDHVIKYQNW